MARKFTFNNTPTPNLKNWEIWLNEDFCRDPYNRNPDGNIAFYNEFAKTYQLLIGAPSLKNSSQLLARFESFNKQQKKVAMLVAHGYSDSMSWRYQDNSLKPVQEWVDGLDQKEYSCLLIGACNPGRREIYSKNVPVIYAKGTIGYLANYSTAIFDPESKSTEEFKRR
jgi:hypothetical protein